MSSLNRISWSCKDALLIIVLVGILTLVDLVGASQSHSSTPSGSAVSIPTEIRVRIVEGASTLEINDDNLAIRLSCKDGKVFRQTEKKKHHKLHHGQSVPLKFQAKGGFVGVDHRFYHDEIQVFPDKKGCTVVNRLPLETYLKGIVNGEFSSKWNTEAILAQVVAARTYAWFQILEAKKKLHLSYDVDASVRDQVYLGPEKEDDKASEAVEKSRGWVLVSTDSLPHSPIKAFYHSTCGGSTETPEGVWGQSYKGLNRRVNCSYCTASPRYHWVLELSSEEVENALFKSSDILKLFTPGSLSTIKVDRTNSKGRVLQLKTVWQKEQGLAEFPVSGVQFRDWIGTTRMRSTLFEVQPSQDSQGRVRWLFRGKGNGHGVGMCQWGAKVMGEKGYSMKDILKFYYPDANLVKLW